MTEVLDLGTRPVLQADRSVEEGLVEIDGEGYYAIADVDRMAPFLMSVVSDGDRWMFVSSAGGLTAGRWSPSTALFPYETDDRLHHAAGVTGPVTVIRVGRGGNETLWRPFAAAGSGSVRRSLYKSVVGNSIVFEEHHRDLQVAFRYRWTSSDEFGFVRTSALVNESADPLCIEIIDGITNLLPYGLDPTVYQRLSNLTNAYKRSEVVDSATRLAVYSLESPVADRPEPSEVLRATIAWSVGLEKASVRVNPDAVAHFGSGIDRPIVSLLTGRPGSYLLSAELDLEPGGAESWHIVADVARDHGAVAEVRRRLRTDSGIESAIELSITAATESLVKVMAPADALQRTGDRVATAHQFANVTYNVMRGGIPLGGYRLDTRDFTRFASDRNRRVCQQHSEWFAALPGTIDRGDLLDRCTDTADPQLVRLALEYLPFSFSRRHGDPSRPWNAFTIHTHDSEGNPVVAYEGNWRDIFQNWEALAMSFPEYLPGLVSVFVNASTADGFNPYRITREGIDWEVPDPDDPWSNIGYWGDHQIVYLYRLLEAADRYLPGAIDRLLGERLFSYAELPYRIAPYQELLRDPKATIYYDDAAASVSAERVAAIGSDGKLMWDDHGDVYHATLLEKLLVPALAKLSNYVAGGGIWMNTQRPEWNDANNALVGFGLSMVTLYQLRPYLEHLRSLLDRSDLSEVAMSAEVADWLIGVADVFRRFDAKEVAQVDLHRRQMLDELGRVYSEYRSQVYDHGFTGLTKVASSEIADLCDAALPHLDTTIRAARRDDGLFHSYNLIRFSPAGASVGVEPLQEMLEGQVAVLGTGVLTPAEQADVVEALFDSAMYRADQKSFLLYPARPLPSFLDKNVVSAEDVGSNPLLTALVDQGDESVIGRDADGRFRFSADLVDQDGLEAALDRLAVDEPWTDLVAAHRRSTLEVYESVFRHHAYTGRSGSMYGYEGIGSIYWHMVAKLLVALQESAVAAATRADPGSVGRLADAYWRVRAGLGFNKTATEFGAIPIDPYSHTPAHAGAQQPGMTGLVKEELLTRPLEVGVRIDGGQICFDSLFLRRSELLESNERWHLYDLELAPTTVELEPGSLGATICQVPVVVSTTSDEPAIEVTFADKSTRRVPGSRLDRAASAAVFARSGEVTGIRAFVPTGLLQTNGPAGEEPE